MDIKDLPQNIIITDEMLAPKEGKFILVVTNHNKDYETIRYMGISEVEAFKKYKDISHNDKIIVSAMVTYSDLFKETYQTEFIIKYEILEIIKKGF